VSESFRQPISSLLNSFLRFHAEVIYSCVHAAIYGSPAFLLVRFADGNLFVKDVAI